MDFEVEITQNTTKNIIRDKKITNKDPVMFLDVKILPERKQLRFRTL